MTEPRKPHLTLVASPITLEKLIVQLRQVTGRDPDPDDIEEARQILAGQGPSGSDSSAATPPSP